MITWLLWPKLNSSVSSNSSSTQYNLWHQNRLFCGWVTVCYSHNWIWAMLWIDNSHNCNVLLWQFQFHATWELVSRNHFKMAGVSKGIDLATGAFLANEGYVILTRSLCHLICLCAYYCKIMKRTVIMFAMPIIRYMKDSTYHFWLQMGYPVAVKGQKKPLLHVGQVDSCYHGAHFKQYVL